MKELQTIDPKKILSHLGEYILVADEDNDVHWVKLYNRAGSFVEIAEGPINPFEAKLR